MKLRIIPLLLLVLLLYACGAPTQPDTTAHNPLTATTDTAPFNAGEGAPDSDTETTDATTDIPLTEGLGLFDGMQITGSAPDSITLDDGTVISTQGGLLLADGTVVTSGGAEENGTILPAMCYLPDGNRVSICYYDAADIQVTGFDTAARMVFDYRSPSGKTFKKAYYDVASQSITSSTEYEYFEDGISFMETDFDAAGLPARQIIHDDSGNQDICYFWENGNVKESSFVLSNGVTLFTSTYFENGNVKIQKNYTESGSFESWVEYDYSSSGTLSRLTNYSAGGSVQDIQEYSGEYITRWIQYDGGTVTDTVYYSESYAPKRSTLTLADGSSQITDFNSDGWITGWKNYDAQGSLTTYAVVTAHGSEGELLSTAEYDAEGNRIDNVLP